MSYRSHLEFAKMIRPKIQFWSPEIANIKYTADLSPTKLLFLLFKCKNWFWLLKSLQKTFWSIFKMSDFNIRRNSNPSTLPSFVKTSIHLCNYYCGKKNVNIFSWQYNTYMIIQIFFHFQLLYWSSHRSWCLYRKSRFPKFHPLYNPVCDCEKCTEWTKRPSRKTVLLGQRTKEIMPGEDMIYKCHDQTR